ncbi:MAG TPA: SMP-30/gluconolactonase/LRE family protein [Opitutales bacterium]|nr:SMP-30/gluconolactonase/LRE family protein [Opitutales bacterium]
MTRVWLFLLLAALLPRLAQAQTDDLFVVNSRTGNIVRVTPAGVITPFAHVNEVQGLGAVGFAVNAHGNLYLAVPDPASPPGYEIYEVDHTGAGKVFARGFPPLGLLAFAADGTLFAGASGKIFKISPAGAVESLPTNITGPTGLAFDTQGTLFVADIAHGDILKVNPKTGAATPFASGLNHPEGLAFDAAGNLFVTDFYVNSVLRVSGTGKTTLLGSVPLARCLAFDREGNLYISSENTDTVYVMDKVGALRPFVSGLDMPLNLAFNHPLLKPADVAPTPPAAAIPLGLLLGIIIPVALIIIVATLVLMAKENKTAA